MWPKEAEIRIAFVLILFGLIEARRNDVLRGRRNDNQIGKKEY